ncbi:TRAF family member-associated NF-kappa-B activator-like [Grus americana]|uniref:TRAF family member-associated NF-kappa-B activator-like n=1 Tax=Grus americana TaxID=9117 RepID=UPI00240853D6|nr:TRAF family member-associated NF-kappa-B activator-like [Grus americana]
MEMEEIFFQLCEEVARLQDLCIKQGKLLQKLTARKGPILDIPVSLPIQCTEDMVMEEGERPPDSNQKCSEAPASAASDPEGSAHPLVQPHAVDTLPGFDGKYAPSAANGSVFGAGTGGAALAVAFGSNKAERNEKVDVETWLKTCRMLPTVKAPKKEVGACCSPQELEASTPVVGDSFLTLLDLYEAPEALRREDAPSESALPAEPKVPVEIRGPVKTSWTPGWMLEDGMLGQGAVLASEGAQACDICQEIFPSDAAGQADYLKHVLAHLK